MGGVDEIMLPEKVVDEHNAAKVVIAMNVVGAVIEFPIFCYLIRTTKEVSSHWTHFSRECTLNSQNQHVFNQHRPISSWFLVPCEFSNQASHFIRFQNVTGCRNENPNWQAGNISNEVVRGLVIRIFSKNDSTIIIIIQFGNNPKVSELSSIYKIEHEQQQDNIPNAVWDSSVRQLPNISGSVPFYEFHYATLKYIFYKIDKINTH